MQVQDALHMSCRARVVQSRSFTWTTLRHVASRTDTERDLFITADRTHAEHSESVCGSFTQRN
jgi:hypothetical protein